MGCGASKSAIDVLPADSSKKPIDQVPKSMNTKAVLKPIPRKDATNIDNDSTKSDRPNSTSSHDSGFADNEYKNVITEKSNPELVRKIEQEFKERNLDLAISGKGVPQLLSNKAEQAEEIKAQQLLQKNGLVQLPVIKKENCVVFDIIDEKIAKSNNNSALVNPNSSLAPLKKVPPRFLKDMDKKLITPEQIAEKLERANQRKMQQTQLKLNTISEMNEKRDVHESSYQHSNSHSKQPMKAQQVPPSYDPEVYERQKKLIEMRDRIRAQNIESATPTPRTPRTQELLNELDKFRSKTPSNFKAVFD